LGWKMNAMASSAYNKLATSVCPITCSGARTLRQSSYEVVDIDIKR
jgi:hypothetical protein